MANPQNYGLYVPTTNVWDVSEVYQATEDPKLQELLVRLYQNLNRLSVATNLKDSAYYVPQEFVNGQAFFPTPGTDSSTAQSPAMRQVFRFVVNFGALPNAGTKSITTMLVPTASWSITRFYGASTEPSTNYIPIPYASNTPNNNIELYADINAGNLRINITTAANWTAYTTTYVIIEYLKT